MTFDPNNPTASGMVLTFDDEFNSLSLSSDGAQDGTTWTNHLWYESGAVNASVSNGVLNLYSNGSSVNMATVDSSEQGFSQKYGFFEARIWVPSGTGTWPAFWLISTDHAQNANLPASEIDVIEGEGASPDGYFGTLHSDSSSSSDQQNANNWIGTSTDISAGWHTYGVLWDPNSNDITYYFDGNPVLTVPKYSTTDSSPMMMVLGNGLGNMDGSNPVTSATPNPSDMQVDWVRAYQFSSQDPTAVASDIATLTDASGSGSSTPTSTTTSTSSTTGSDTLTIHVSGDQWQGDPQFVVLVDGQQVGGTQDVSASHDAGQWQDITLTGDFSNAQQVQIEFTNDASAGSHAEDRNLYVGSITLDGHQYQGNTAVSNTAAAGFQAMDPTAAVMVQDGTATFDVSGATSAQTASSGTGSSTATSSTTTAASGSTTAASGSATATVPALQTFMDGAGHDVYVVTSASQTGATISDFHSGQDILDLAPILHAMGYTGQDPVADHVVQLTQDASGNTEVSIDPQGAGADHTSTTITLEHVTPQEVSQSLWH